MPIAISDDHTELGLVASDFLAKHDSRGEARLLLESDTEGLPDLWEDLRSIGWLGLHLPEGLGGSGFGLPELVVVVEETGRAVTPGPFVPTVIASAFIDAAASDPVRERLLPGLADGTVAAAVAITGDLELRDGVLHGSTSSLVGGGLGQLLVIAVGGDVVLVDRSAAGVSIDVPPNLDPTRRTARATFDATPAEIVAGGGALLLDFARTIYAAEAVGIARSCTEQAAEYAGVRKQFGRVIGTFQAVKHHCANMAVATELAAGAVWEAAGAAAGKDAEFSLAAAMAAVLAVTGAEHNAQLNIQVHGGIGFTWEHDAHLYLRRATTLQTIVDVEAAAIEVTDLYAAGTRLSRSLELRPPEAETIRAELRPFVESLVGLDDDARLEALLDSGYAMPSWPKPWGRAAGAVEQLVIQQEFDASDIKRLSYSITGWVILTLIQHGTDDQVARWVRPALAQDVIWCQLFSEPDAGSDAAGITTRATRVDGGWLINGQKVWTSGAHVAGFGLATVRTDPEAQKHAGISATVIDMHAEGVEIRPLRMPSGQSEFNEVFFNDVFVPDDDVVGAIGDGWTVARSTLGNESVSLGGGDGGITFPTELFFEPLREHPERLAGGAARVGRHIAKSEASSSLNQRRVHRAVAGGAPGPEGAVTKLVLSENLEESAAIMVGLTGPDGAFLDGPGAISSGIALMHRALAIAGGTSEIKRNQIGERLLGLPRDPLIK